MNTPTPERVKPHKEGASRSHGLDVPKANTSLASVKSSPSGGTETPRPNIPSANIQDRQPKPVGTGHSHGLNVPKPDFPSGKSPKSRYPK